MITTIQQFIEHLLSVSTYQEQQAVFREDEKPKKIYIHENVVFNMQSLLFELEALKKGLHMERSSESSSSRSSKRSKSLSEKQGLPVLPKKTRAKILEELEMTCREMRDSISLDHFEDMKKKKLQLVVQIGPKGADGKQNCYYVKNIFDYVKNELANKRLPKDPNTRVPITEEEMRSIILPKMRYIKVNVADPFQQEREPARRFPNIELEVENVEDEDGRPYYRVGYSRRIGSLLDTKYRNFGFIPLNIYVHPEDRISVHATDVFTNDSSLSSATIIVALNELSNKGLLTDIYGSPKVHINKTMRYWNTDVVNKARLMLDEFNNYLQ